MTELGGRDVRPKRLAVVALAGTLVVITAAAAWRWMPRPAIPPTEEMRRAARLLPAQLRRPFANPPRPPLHPTSSREKLLAAASALQGKPYKWGAKGPDAYDCSGFTKAAYAKIGVTIPDGSFNQAEGEQPLSDPGAMKPGDLIFYRWPGSDSVKHVTMYVGDGWVLGTGSPGQPARVTLYPLSDDLLVKGAVITYRHIVLPGED